MTPILTPVAYSRLNARQKEAYNFQKLSALLADYGYATMRLQDDWEGADLIAQHCDGQGFLKIQLKGRATLAKKYQGKNLLVACPHQGAWYLYDHDDLLEFEMVRGATTASASWREHGSYSWPALPRVWLQSGHLIKLSKG